MKNSRVWRPVVPRGLRKRAATLAAQLEFPLYVVSRKIYERGLIEMEHDAKKSKEIEERSAREARIQ